MKTGGFGLRPDIEFAVQCLCADPELSDRVRVASQVAIQSHQPPVDPLLQRVDGQQPACGIDRTGVIRRFCLIAQQPVEGGEREFVEPPLFAAKPFLETFGRDVKPLKKPAPI